MDSRLSLFNRLMLVLNIFSVIFLGMAILAAYISPDGIFWFLQIISLTFGILVLINTAFIIYWLIVRKKLSLISLIAILAGASRIFGIVQPGFNRNPDQPDHSVTGFPVKVMSFNVRLFDLYNWFHNYQTHGKIYQFLKKESPDITCFQEYYSSDRKLADFDNNKSLPPVLDAPYSHIEYTVTLRDSDHWGIAIYSKYPIVNRKAVHFEKRGGNIFIYSDIKIGDDTVRVFNTHLESIRFRNEDYRYFENLKKDVEQEDVAGGIKILQRLRRAYAKRASQVEKLKSAINESPYPVIVAGDFNDTPSSYTYHRLVSGLKDAFRESGTGFGNTYSGLFPSFRIDYLFHSGELFSTHYETHRQKISDHFAITCWIDKSSR